MTLPKIVEGGSPWWTAFLNARTDVLAGVTVAFVTLPICLASGVLAFAPFGPEYLASGAAAGLYGAVYGGIIAALAARSSAVSSSPRTSVAIVHASLAALIVANIAPPHDQQTLIALMATCVLLAGLWQLLFGLINVARVIKFAPYPVLAGFLNGVALLIVFAQIKPFLDASSAASIDGWARAALVMAVAASILTFAALTKRIPAQLVGLFFGAAVFHLAKAVFPGVNLGGTIGDLAVVIVPNSPLRSIFDLGFQQMLGSNLPHILLVSLAVAVVATIESLLTIRIAQNLMDLPPEPRRNVFGQGLGNSLSGLAGGLAIAASPSQTTAAINAGGRTRLVSIVAAISLLMLAIALPRVLAGIPVAVLSGLLLAIGIQLFDRWSLRLLNQSLKSPPSQERSRGWLDLFVVLVVMGVTASISVVAGILVGFVLAGTIFIINMSRPIVGRRYVGPVSKRFRSDSEAHVLRDQCQRRVVLELQGVLFFGNADDLSNMVAGSFERADMIALDLRGVSDIDASGATILRNLSQRSERRGKRLLFCNVPKSHEAIVEAVVAGVRQPVIFADLESTLEWMEEQVLASQHHASHNLGPLQLKDHDLARGLNEHELTQLEDYLIHRERPAQSPIMSEGEESDSLLLLMQGSVSVRLRVSDARGSRRMASLSKGTTLGAGAFLKETSSRIATMMADEPVIYYELPRKAYECMLQDHPVLAAKIAINCGREMARRLRTTLDDFRDTTS